VTLAAVQMDCPLPKSNPISGGSPISRLAAEMGAGTVVFLGCPYLKLKGLRVSRESADSRMGELYRLIWCAMVGFVPSRAALQAEILVLPTL
jgi:hypothetical protein